MTKSLLQCLAATVLLFLGAAPPAAGAPNLLVNGGLEAGAEGRQPGELPQGWRMWKVATLEPGELALDRAVKRSGEVSARFTDATHGLAQHVRVRPGDMVHFRCYFRTDLRKGGAGLGIGWLNKEGKWVFDPETGKQITHNRNLYGIADWREAELTNIRVPATAVSARVSVGPVFGAKGEFWVDDVAMEAVPGEKPREAHKSTVAINRTTSVPTLDGKLAEPLWDSVAQITHFTIPKLKALARRQTAVSMAYDDLALYLGVHCQEPDMDRLCAQTTERDGGVYNDDCVEIFLAPGGAGEEQFHFIFNSAGVRYDAREIWDPATGSARSKEDWDPEWQVATHIGADAWTAEARIPFAEIGTPTPARFSRWAFNVTRHRANGSKFSSWAPLGARIFQRPGWFGRLVFADDTVAIRPLGVNGERAAVSVTNPAGRKASVTFRVECFDGETYWTLGRTDATVGANAREVLNVELGGDPAGRAGVVWTTVSAGDRVLHRQGCIPAKDFAAVTWYDPEDVLGNTLYVASDLRTWKGFKTIHNFETDGPNGLIYRDERPVDLVFELPEGVRATFLVEFVNNWMWFAPVAPAGQTPVRLGDRTRTRYRFEVPAVMNYAANMMAVFFDCDLPAGASAVGTCHLQWDGGRQPPRKVNLRVIEIGRTPPLTRMFNGIYYAEAELLLSWLPDIGNVYPTLGLNRVEIDPQPTVNYAQGGPREKWFSRKPWFDRLVKQARAGGLYMATSPSQSTPWFQNWTSKDPDARAVDVNGRPVLDRRWAHTYSLCPLYRGPKFQAHLATFTGGPAFREYGLTWLAVDLELWSDEAWRRGGFCDRCTAAFKTFAAERYPGQTFGDPRVFMKVPGDHPEGAAAWEAFREWSKVQFIRGFREPIAAVVAEHGLRSAPGIGKKLVVSEWCFPKESLFGAVDYFEINCYRRPAEVARRLGAARETAGDRPIVVATPSSGQTHSLDAMLTPDDMRFAIYESAVAGVRGMVWYDVLGFDALRLQTLVSGVRTIQPFEDLILDGVCHLELPCGSDEASARCVTLDAETLALVRAYGTATEAVAAVTLPCGGESMVHDCEDGTVLGSVTPENPQITVTVPAGQARLLYVGRDGGWGKRCPATTED